VLERLVDTFVVKRNQSQVNAMRAFVPSFVSVEVGINEVLPAVLSGLLVPFAGQVPAAPFRPDQIPAGSFTYIPAAISDPLITAIIDSVKLSGARALVATVPNVVDLPGLYRGDQIFADRAALAAIGIIVDAGCATSQNFVFVPEKLGALLAAGASPGTPAPLRCDDIAGARDNVLTPANVATLNGVVTAMNQTLRTQATAREYPVLDLDVVMHAIAAKRPPFSITRILGCLYPFGQDVSLDGVHPSQYGASEIANAAIAVVNTRYGFTLPAITIPVLTQAELCP
jgi:hypothetical protein